LRNPEMRRAIARFLKNRRTLLLNNRASTDAIVGFRPTCHLAEDIARLAKIRTQIYLRLEQGRDVPLTWPMIERIAQALELNAADKQTLFSLCNLTEVATDSTAHSPLCEIVGHLQECPAFVCSSRLDVIAFNQLAQRLFDIRGDGSTYCTNQLWRVYTDPSRRRLFKDVRSEQAFLLQLLSAKVHRGPCDADLVSLVTDLVATSPTFARDWSQRGNVAAPAQRTVAMKVSAETSQIELQFTVHALAAQMEETLFALTPANDSTVRALRSLLTTQAKARRRRSAMIASSSG
jgi:hypothetical protein